MKGIAQNLYRDTYSLFIASSSGFGSKDSSIDSMMQGVAQNLYRDTYSLSVGGCPQFLSLSICSRYTADLRGSGRCCHGVQKSQKCVLWGTFRECVTVVVLLCAVQVHFVRSPCLFMLIDLSICLAITHISVLLFHITYSYYVFMSLSSYFIVYFRFMYSCLCPLIL